jgi:SAM-dependent methyltransferase
MDKYEETFNSWDKVSELYEQKFMHLELYNDTYESFLKHLPTSGSAVLELGCGPGNITAYLLRALPSLKIDATDVSPNMVKLAAKNNPAARCFIMDCRHINQLQKNYGGIIGGFILPYLSPADTEKLIHDCGQLLDPGGSLYLSFVDGDDANSGFQTGSSGYRVHFYYHRLQNLHGILKDNNFEIVQLFNKRFEAKGPSEFHTILIARKSV